MAQPYIPTETEYTRTATLLVSGQSQINAPASHVFSLHTDIARYPEWNTFTPTASASTLPLTEGCSLTLKAKMSAFAPPLPIFTRVTEILRPDNTTSTSNGNTRSDGTQGGVYRISWDASMIPGFVLATHRVTEVIPDGPDRCKFTTYETMSGMSAYLIRMLLGGNLQEKFEGWCSELKGFAEKTWKEQEQELQGKS